MAVFVQLKPATLLIGRLQNRWVFSQNLRVSHAWSTQSLKALPSFTLHFQPNSRPVVWRVLEYAKILTVLQSSWWGKKETIFKQALAFLGYIKQWQWHFAHEHNNFIRNVSKTWTKCYVTKTPHWCLYMYLHAWAMVLLLFRSIFIFWTRFLFQGLLQEKEVIKTLPL